VIRRRLSEQLLDALEIYAKVSSNPLGYVLWRDTYPKNRSYYNAVHRLRKTGLIAHRQEGGRESVLRIAEPARRTRPIYFRPERFWNVKWDGRWYLLMYDVPEAQREFRDTLRYFLKQHRMGSLQRSVWVTSQDIRPDFDDLVRAVGVDEFAFLFESRTVLGRGEADVVANSWDFEALEKVQSLYCEVYQQNLDHLGSNNVSKEALVKLAHEEIRAFHTAMINDPLLPRALHLAEYVGEKVWQLHNRMVEAVQNRL